MISHVYQLVAPKTFQIKFQDEKIEGKVLIRPRFMALCHADGRYYWGRRDPAVLRKKLPMALIHECVGQVLADPTGHFSIGEEVALIPNIPGTQTEEIFENYAEGSGFLSSGHDGFMREFVALDPDRVVSAEGVDWKVAAITEFVSVAVHAVNRFSRTAHSERKRIAVIGDGSLGFVLACVLSQLMPESKLTIIGHDQKKLSLFSFADKRHLSDQIPDDARFDHVFECAGGAGCEEAYAMAVSHMRPQGTLMLMGVSERAVPLYTRDVLEKGMTLVGCSRSGREDFERAVEILRVPEVEHRLRQIIYLDEPVRSVADIKRVFATDVQTSFKTAFEWGL